MDDPEYVRIDYMASEAIYAASMAALHSKDHALVHDRGMLYVQHYPSMEKRLLATFMIPSPPEAKWYPIWKTTQDALTRAHSETTGSYTPHTRTSR